MFGDTLFGAGLVAAGSVRPEDIQPTFDAPWMSLLGTAGGWAVGTALVAMVIVMVVGLVIWIGGKLSSSGRGQEVGLGALMWAVVAVVLLGAVGGLVAWASGLPLF